jgi:hypothetical protein
MKAAVTGSETPDRGTKSQKRARRLAFGLFLSSKALGRRQAASHTGHVTVPDVKFID